MKLEICIGPRKRDRIADGTSNDTHNVFKPCSESRSEMFKAISTVKHR